MAHLKKQNDMHTTRVLSVRSRYNVIGSFSTQRNIDRCVVLELLVELSTCWTDDEQVGLCGVLRACFNTRCPEDLLI